MPKRPNEAWSPHIVHDQLSHGTTFRALPVVGIWSRKGLAIEVGQRLKGEHVAAVLNRLVRQQDAPTEQTDRQRLHCDLQRLAAGRVPEPALARDAGRSPCHRRGLAIGLS